MTIKLLKKHALSITIKVIERVFFIGGMSVPFTYDVQIDFIRDFNMNIKRKIEGLSVALT
ncbi:hypothetical protein SAMN05216232_3071 [Virgibacillus subterraneus]|uniref:Uncharacterized protein n=2 Tax=Virgibacillus TaxID=84406 RepID=A0A1H1FIM5_9BACI|nr:MULTISPECIES: hypothetical protein [Virgibacillus]SDR00775.1 hypothetical protein SAMN05216231_3235 [Virgibacillus salinus]SEQ70498.1 hypothetical protein SAMN05216232_3071 [Virgibacillus subterraneus]